MKTSHLAMPLVCAYPAAPPSCENMPALGCWVLGFSVRISVELSFTAKFESH